MYNLMLYSKAHILRLLQFFLARDLLSSELHAFCESYPMSQRLNSLYIHHVKCVKLEIKIYLKKQFHPGFKGNIKYKKKYVSIQHSNTLILYWWAIIFPNGKSKIQRSNTTQDFANSIYKNLICLCI